MVELHCHLDGSLSEAVVREMAENIGLSLPEGSALQKELRAEEHCENLADYLKRFDIPLACLTTPQNLRLAAEDFMRQAREDGLFYIETRFAPLSLLGRGMSCFEAIEAVVEGIKAGEKKYGVYGNVILCAMRHQSPEENLELVRAGKDFFHHGVCGFDVAGDEAGFPIEGQAGFLKAVRAENMLYTLHAGECGSAASVRAAIELGASRLGHGIAMQGHPELIKLCREKGLGIEMCPTSNFQTRAAKDWNSYPLQEFYQAGLAVTLNTDNRSVSDTTMQKEWERVRGQYGFTEEVLQRLTENAIEQSFADDSIKQKLLERLRSA